MRYLKKYKSAILWILVCVSIGFLAPTQISYFIFGMIMGAGALASLVVYFCDVRRKHPYSWECTNDGCDFKISANDPATVAVMADRHPEYCEHKEN
jgi:hypothetical protein